MLSLFYNKVLLHLTGSPLQEEPVATVLPHHAVAQWLSGNANSLDATLLLTGLGVGASLLSWLISLGVFARSTELEKFRAEVAEKYMPREECALELRLLRQEVQALNKLLNRLLPPVVQLSHTLYAFPAEAEAEPTKTSPKVS
jgi:hypothetical protein